jgi:hypothetical protein
MADSTLMLKVPAGEVPAGVRSEVERVLTQLAPVVAARVQDKRRENMNVLVDALLNGVEMRGIDVRRARMQAKALRSVLEGTEWLTAEQIGERGGFSVSNLAARANRWKQESKIFALNHEGQDRFPRYALDESFRPLAGLVPVLAELGAISPWSTAIWFESTNAWLDAARPRERLSVDPAAVLYASQQYRNMSHG